MLYKMELLDHKSRERAGGMPTAQGAHMPVLLDHDVAVKVSHRQLKHDHFLPRIRRVHMVQVNIFGHTCS